jgi:hypothetical protein
MNSVIENIITDIQSRSKPVQSKVEKNGEVFTPFNLINEMLDKLPIEVWSNPNLKWLDPTSGICNFPIILIQRLFIGLQYYILDENERLRHIIENMIYMNELDTENYNISLVYMKQLCGDNTYKINLYQGDFLTLDSEKMLEIWNVNRFDVIIGNPPYNSGGIRSAVCAKNKTRFKKDGDPKSFTIWIPIIKKCLELLNEYGYLDVITPIGWFINGKTNIHETLLSYQIDYIRIYKDDKAKKMFNGNGNINVAYYILQKIEASTRHTIIHDMLNNIDTLYLTKNSILTPAHNTIYSKIQSKSTLLGNNAKSTHCIRGDYIRGDYRSISKILQTGNVHVISTEKKHRTHDIPKLIFNGYNYARYIYDKDGIYGAQGGDIFYIIGDNLEKIIEFFNTKLCSLLILHLKMVQDKIKPQNYPDVRLLPLDIINDETLSQFYGFTDDEKISISKMKLPHTDYNFIINE